MFSAMCAVSFSKGLGYLDIPSKGTVYSVTNISKQTTHSGTSFKYQALGKFFAAQMV